MDSPIVFAVLSIYRLLPRILILILSCNHSSTQIKKYEKIILSNFNPGRIKF